MVKHSKEDNSSFECLTIQFGKCECKVSYVWARDIVQTVYFLRIKGFVGSDTPKFGS